jgi:hypothetical protein
MGQKLSRKLIQDQHPNELQLQRPGVYKLQIPLDLTVSGPVTYLKKCPY